MTVGIRHDTQTGLFRWFHPECGAGTGVEKSGDVPDRTPVAVAQRTQWGTYADAVRGMIGHRITHREHRGFMVAGVGKRPTPGAFGARAEGAADVH